MKQIFYILALLALSISTISCEEKEEATKYDNWKERNQTFCDSIAELAGENYIATLEQIKNVKEGEFFILQDVISSTNKADAYIYCKKLVANPEGERPFWLSTVNVYYSGTLINGEKFGGNFNGYTALDKEISPPFEKYPSEDFDVTTQFTISSDEPYYLTTGWCTFLQYMHTGERWLIYVPWRSAYGAEGKDNVLGYSVLTFDVTLKSITVLRR